MADAVIEVYEGLLGGGKTYGCVQRIFESLLSGYIVYTNIELVWPAIESEAKKRGVNLDPNQYQYIESADVGNFFEKVTSGGKTLLVIDELAIFFNARHWQKTSVDVIVFLTQARKLGVHTLLICQDRSLFDKQFRVLVAFWWMCSNLNNKKLFGIRFPIRCMVHTCFQGGVGKQVQVDTRYLFFNKAIGGMYKSTQLLAPVRIGLDRPKIEGFGKVVKEKKHWVRRWPVKVVGAMVICWAVMMFRRPAVAEAAPVVEVAPSEVVEPVDDRRYYAGLYQSGAVYHIALDGRWVAVPVNQVEIPRGQWDPIIIDRRPYYPAAHH